MQESLAKRAISSTLWQSSASLITTAIVFVRSVLLARWVPVEAFGIYGYAGAIIGFSSILADFGMGAAFIHQTQETEDESEAAANYLAVKAVLAIVWAALVIACSRIFIAPQYRPALVILTLIQAGTGLTAVPRLILQRRVVHRRLSLLSTLDIVVGSVAALSLALLKQPLWALMVTNLAGLAVNVIGLYVWRPVWRPKLRWSPPVVRYLLGFGARSFVAGLLARAFDQLDDIWTGSVLGSVAVGFYSKAYSFATYPRKVVAAPLIAVSTGSYAALKGDRQRLSEAFFRVNAALVRSSFLFGGLLALIAPEFIRILLGAQWLPMLNAYRLMLVFTLLDPLKVTIANLFTAVGKPEHVITARVVQLLVLVVGLAALGPRFDIAGVAIAVDVMLFNGIVLLLWRARVYVDFSPVRLFGIPILALALGMAVARGTLALPGILGSDWRTAGVKICAYGIVYAGVLLLIERHETARMVRWTVATLRS